MGRRMETALDLSPKKAISHRREILKLLRSILEAHPDLEPGYEHAKKIIRVFRKPAFYEITTQCNLSCEGCYYFDYNANPIEYNQPLGNWDSFFAAEAERGVSMAYFLGAEPALRQDRLHAAVPYFTHGNIGSNGTIPIDKDVPFRIAISVWGAEETDARLRKNSQFRQAVNNVEGDARVNMLYTVTHFNIGQIKTVADICRDSGLELTFNLYSPTDSLLKKLEQKTGKNKPGSAAGTPQDTPCLTEDDLARTHDLLGCLMEDYPDTILYSQAYNDWSTKPGSLYTINPDTGIAEDCHSRILPPMRYYSSELKTADVKCCTPALNCSHCRMYSGGWSSKFEPEFSDVKSVSALKNWIEMIRILGRIFLYKKNEPQNQRIHSQES